MKALQKLIREMIPVIIGILIALLINNWNETRKDNKYLDKIFASIEQELVESIEDIDRVLPKQYALIDTIELYLDNDTITVFDLLTKADGIQSPEIKINSWRAIAGSKIELIDFDQLSELSFIEECKDNLKNRVLYTGDFVLENITETSRKKKELLRYLTIDAMNAELRLKKAIEAYLGEDTK